MIRGRMSGGSSAVNFATYNKPSKEDIDGESGTLPVFRFVYLRKTAWEQLGNEGWNWDRFNKYMERAVT